MLKSRKPLQVWVNNILKAYSLASEVDKAGGLSWYQSAYEWGERIASEYGIKTYKVVGALAALSPMTNWNQNLKDTSAILQNRRAVVTTYKSNKQKALKILNGKNPRVSLGKFKTLSFYNCIIGSHSDVCIDRHAAAIAYGRVLTDKERGKVTGVLYQRLQNAYRLAGQAVGLKPSQVQAVTWVYWRRNNKLEKLRKFLNGGKDNG